MTKIIKLKALQIFSFIVAALSIILYAGLFVGFFIALKPYHDNLTATKNPYVPLINVFGIILSLINLMSQMCLISGAKNENVKHIKYWLLITSYVAAILFIFIFLTMKFYFNLNDTYTCFILGMFVVYVSFLIIIYKYYKLLKNKPLCEFEQFLGNNNDIRTSVDGYINHI